LWFLVDTHHRERYFFICSLLTECYGAGLVSRLARQRRTDKTRYFTVADFPVFAENFQDLTQAALRRLRQSFHHFSSIERNP